MRIDESYSNTRKKDSEEIPKGPILKHVLLTDYDRTGEIGTIALIDSGSDGTAVNREMIERLEVELGGDVPFTTVIDPDNGVKGVNYKGVGMIISGVVFMPEFGIDRLDDGISDIEDALIGRDILNQLIVVLDGPNEVFTIIGNS